ncbi:MAG: hypothetical protein ABI333_24990 [bacterium]
MSDGAGKHAAVPPIPVGVEELVSMAAASDEYARELVVRRGEAAAASGVELTPTEQAMLRAIDDAALRKVIQEWKGKLPAPERREFLERASAALVLLVGGGVLTGAAGCEKQKSPTGSQRPRAEPGGQAVKGIRPGPQDAAVRRPRGADVRAGMEAVRGPFHIQAGISPAPPDRPKRPEQPGSPKTGSRPDRPRKERLDVDTGARPDLSGDGVVK